RRGEQVGDVPERGDLLGDGGDDGRVAVAEQVHRDAAEEVDVGAAGLVDDDGAAAADQTQRRRTVRVHDRSLEPRRQRTGHCPTTMVPNPSDVNTSSNSEWGTRPSTTCAAGTPPLTARRQASIFGTIPDCSVGSSSVSSSALSCEISEDGSG